MASSHVISAALVIILVISYISSHAANGTILPQGRPAPPGEGGERPVGDDCEGRIRNATKNGVPGRYIVKIKVNHGFKTGDSERNVGPLSFKLML